MNISLRSFTIADIRSVKQWARNIEAGQYQSRIFPHAFNGKDLSGVTVCVHGMLSLWMEKKPARSGWRRKLPKTNRHPGNHARAEGIFGKGIGRQAVLQAIGLAQIRLAFRSVVLTVRRDNDPGDRLLSARRIFHQPRRYQNQLKTAPRYPTIS